VTNTLTDEQKTKCATLDPNDARTFSIAVDREGFFILDGNGEELFLGNAGRWLTWADAKQAVDGMVADDLAELRERGDAA
jgi:hypothetical protein